MQSSPSYMTLIRDLVGCRLAAWNSQLGRLCVFHLSQGSDEFRKKLHENGQFSEDFMYRALVHPEMQVVVNKFFFFGK